MNRLNSSLLFGAVLLARAVFADEPVVRFALQPPAESLPAASPPPTLPPVEVRPESRPSTEPADNNFDPNALPGPLGYPSLTQQLFGGPGGGEISGLNSASRGAQSLFENPNHGSIVDSGTIREKEAQDMFRALQFEVGVLIQATGRGQASPFIRGVTGQQVLVLVDGVRMNNTVLRAGPNQYFNTIDPGQVERIEVIRGGGSVPWGGDAIGGVINIVTRSADSSAGHYFSTSARNVFSSADSGYYGRGNIEGWIGNSGVFAGGSYYEVHDLDRGGGLGRQPFTNYDQYAGDVKYNWLVDDCQMITVFLSHFEQEDLPRSDRFAPFVFNRPGNTPRPTWFDPQQRDLTYIRWQGFTDPNPFVDVFSFTASYSRTKEGSRELRSATQLDLGEFTDDMLGFTLTLQRDFDCFGKLTYGGDYYYEDVDSRRRRINPNTGVPAASQPTSQFPDDGRADRAGAFTNWEICLGDRLTAVAGVRYENGNLAGTPRYTISNVNQFIHFHRTYQDWIGSLGLTYKLTDEWELVGGVYEGYRSPTLDDLTANVTFQQNAQQDPVLASLAVQPEHSYTYEVGTKLNLERTRLQAYQWWMTIDDYIARTVVANNVFLGNHEAYLYGTELYGEQLLDDGWALYGNFAYTFGDDLTDNVPFSRIPPAQGVVGLRWRDECNLNYFDLYTWLVDRQDRYNPTNLTDSRFFVNGVAATPGYATLNLRTGTTLGECLQHRVSLVLENITDKYYRVLGSGVDGTGFNAIVAYEFRH